MVTPSENQQANRYADTDFDKANRLINRTGWSFLHNVSSIDSAWDLWEQKFMSVMETCIPKATISQQRNLPWMNRKGNSVYRKARTTGFSALWSKYTFLRNQKIRTIKEETLEENEIKYISRKHPFRFPP